MLIIFYFQLKKVRLTKTYLPHYQEYQLVFMDIGLPKMSGIETALAIRGLTH